MIYAFLAIANAGSLTGFLESNSMTIRLFYRLHWNIKKIYYIRSQIYCHENELIIGCKYMHFELAPFSDDLFSGLTLASSLKVFFLLSIDWKFFRRNQMQIGKSSNFNRNYNGINSFVVNFQWNGNILIALNIFPLQIIISAEISVSHCHSKRKLILVMKSSWI